MTGPWNNDTHLPPPKSTGNQHFPHTASATLPSHQQGRYYPLLFSLYSHPLLPKPLHPLTELQPQLLHRTAAVIILKPHSDFTPSLPKPFHSSLAAQEQSPFLTLPEPPLPSSLALFLAILPTHTPTVSSHNLPYSSNRPGFFLPLGLCTCYSFCLSCSVPTTPNHPSDFPLVCLLWDAFPDSLCVPRGPIFPVLEPAAQFPCLPPNHTGNSLRADTPAGLEAQHSESV